MTTTAPSTTAPSGAAAPPVLVAPVKVELPAFDSADVDTWIAMCDNLMNDAGLSVEATMFRKLLAKLPPSHFRLVKHLATASPLPPKCYTELKAVLRRKLQLTPAVRLQRLEQIPPCAGDRTPSALFADIDALYPRDHAHEIIREHFLRRLPPSLQLLCREWLEKDTLADVALKADAHFPAHCHVTVAHVSDVNEESTEYSASIAAVQRRTSKSHGVSQRGASRGEFVERWCRIHRRYGPAARNCVKPCSFTSDVAQGNGPSNRQ
jgi:hypothetical protein